MIVDSMSLCRIVSYMMPVEQEMWRELRLFSTVELTWRMREAWYVINPQCSVLVSTLSLYVSLKSR